MPNNPTPSSTTKTPKLRFPEFSRAWEEKKFEDLFISEPTKKYQINSSEFLVQGQIPVVDQSPKLISGYSNQTDKVFTTSGSIIFGDHTTILKYVNFNFIIGADGTKVFNKKFDNYNLKYLYYSLTYNNIEQEGYKRHFSILKNLKVSVSPSLPEQTKIAEFLTAVDDKIQLLDSQKKQLELYKKGLLQAMFPNNLGKIKIRFLDVGGVSFPDWAEKKLGEIGEIVTGTTPATSIISYYGNDYLFVSPSDINNSRFIFNTKNKLSKQGFLTGRKIRKNSVLFVCIGSTIGKIAQTKSESITNQQINAIVSNEQNNDDFIYSNLERESKKIKGLSATQAVPIINKTTFSNYKSYFPSLPEQTKIADFLTSLDDKISVTSEEIEQTKLWKKGLLQAMMV